MRGYWGDKEATEKAMSRDGWFRSGDSGYIDEEGFIYIKDRSKSSHRMPDIGLSLSSYHIV